MDAMGLLSQPISTITLDGIRAVVPKQWTVRLILEVVAMETRPHNHRLLSACQSLLMGLLLVLSALSSAAETADLVVVNKSDKKLYLYKRQQILASFPVVFGANPHGHKQQEGDERTPEGRYVLDFKKSASGYYRSIHISYPNAQDMANARSRGVAPGGFVMIHGQRNGFGWASFLTQRFNWTNGCIALSNEDMEVVWQSIGVGTPIEIRP